MIILIALKRNFNLFCFIDFDDKIVHKQFQTFNFCFTLIELHYLSENNSEKKQIEVKEDAKQSKAGKNVLTLAFSWKEKLLPLEEPRNILTDTICKSQNLSVWLNQRRDGGGLKELATRYVLFEWRDVSGGCWSIWME